MLEMNRQYSVPAWKHCVTDFTNMTFRADSITENIRCISSLPKLSDHLDTSLQSFFEYQSLRIMTFQVALWFAAFESNCFFGLPANNRK